MDKNVIYSPISESLTYSPVFGTGDTVPVDQQPVQSFNIDPATGCPMSDLTAIIRSQGLDRERMLANLNEFRADYLPADTPDDQALKYMCPRLAQMPSELAEHVEFVTSKRLEEKKLLDEQKEFEEFKKSLLNEDDDKNTDKDKS